jgi:hypothetical protein
MSFFQNGFLDLASGGGEYWRISAAKIFLCLQQEVGKLDHWIVGRYRDQKNGRREIK